MENFIFCAVMILSSFLLLVNKIILLNNGWLVPITKRSEGFVSKFEISVC